MLDKIPPAARHFILLLAIALLTIGQEKITGLNIPNEIKPLVAAAIAALLLTLTPLTRQYGVGAANLDVPADPGAQAAADDLLAEPLTDPVSSQTDPGVPDTTDIPGREGDF
jgi:hypothetical protein